MNELDLEEMSRLSEGEIVNADETSSSSSENILKRRQERSMGDEYLPPKKKQSKTLMVRSRSVVVEVVLCNTHVLTACVEHTHVCGFSTFDIVEFVVNEGRGTE